MQKDKSQTNTVDIKRIAQIAVSLVCATLVIVFLAGVLFGGASAANKIIVAGSTSVQPYAELLGEEFEHTHPDVKIDVSGGGSAAGLDAAHRGIAQIGMSSSSLKGDDLNLWNETIAEDGLAIIINPKNPLFSAQNPEVDLTTEQIRKIYTGEIKKWSGLGLPLYGKDNDIHLITREEGSGTRDAFDKFIMTVGTAPDTKILGVTPKSIVESSNGAIRYLVSDDTDAIGFISLGLVASKKGEKDVKSIKVNGVAASFENVKNKSYKLSRPFIFVSKQKPVGHVKEFVDFVLSAEGKRILEREGLIVDWDKIIE